MTFTDKASEILNDKHLMTPSSIVRESLKTAVDVSGKPVRRKINNIIKRAIRYKLKHPEMNLGVCVCPEHMLCDHRRDYIIKAITK